MKQVQCDYNMSFAECELAILRSAVDLAQETVKKRIISSPEIKNIIEIVEQFLKKKKLICYGGTAINNILPESGQFYNKEVDIPDYDFFSPNAMEDAIELCDIYYKKGYKEVEAKAGQHYGTYKVFVNFISIADISFLPVELFNSIKEDSLTIKGILYCPPNYLRMLMYLELSRPAGDTSRWEKVMKRLSLLNEYYPLTSKNCYDVDFQRKMEDTKKSDEIYKNVKQTFINQGCVFFGGYAISLYAKYMPYHFRKKLDKIPDFDVLSNDPELVCEIVKKNLKDIGIKNVSILEKEPIGEVIPVHYEIRVGDDTVAFVYTPVGCHSYNIIENDVRIATIDTMLSFYLAFLYAKRPYYDTNRIVCMSKYLFEIQQKNRLEQKGLLKRFSITCYGHQKSIEEIRAEKFKKFGEFKKKKGTREYNQWFLSYKPYLNDLITKTETNRDDTLTSLLLSELDVKPKIETHNKKRKIKRGTRREKKRTTRRETIKVDIKKKNKTLKSKSEPKCEQKTESKCEENPKSKCEQKPEPKSEQKTEPKPEIEYRFW